MPDRPTQPHDGAGDSVRIVVPRFGAAIVGGAENAMRRLAEELARRSWSVEVWTTTALDEATWSPGFAAGRERDGDIEVRRFPVVARRMPWLFEQLSHGAYHLPANLRPEHLWAIAQGPFAPALIRALSTSDPVPTLFSPYLFHTTLYGIPAAPHPRILCPAAHDEPALRLGIVRRAVAGADGLWFHSPEERDLLVSVHPGAGRLPSRCGVVGIQPPPDLDAFAFAARHRITGPYLYYGGRAAGGKGLEQLIAGMGLAHAARPGLRLVLSGDASTSASAPWMIGVGRLGERERWEAIAGAAAVVVPGSMESLSLLALDAWAMGRPCLLNAASAVLAGHAARSGGGLTFDGPEQLAAGAIELLDQPDRAALLGSAGREYVLSTYRWDLAEQRLRELVSAPSR